MTPRSLAVAAALATAAPAVAGERPASLPPHADLDAWFTYSIGSQSALGGELLARAPFDVWGTRHGTGSVDVGLLVGFQAEPWTLAPWVDQATQHGLNTHTRLLPNLGHTFHLGRRRNVDVGVHLYGGVVVWTSHADLDLAAQGVVGSKTVSRVVGDVGAFVRVAWRPHPVVGVSILLGAPFYGLSSSSYVTDLFTVGAGLTFRVR